LQFKVGDFVYLRVSPTRGIQRFGIKENSLLDMSQLRKCIKTPTEIIDSQAIEIESDLSYTKHLIRILDTKERSTRRETVRMFKIQWNHDTEEEATWEIESYLQRNFPDFLRANPHI
jgi:hypothetical protein